MVENKLKESIRVAEEMAHEWCTGEETDSALLRAWKQQSPQLYEDIRRQQSLADEIAFREAVELDEPLKNIHRRLFSARRRAYYYMCAAGAAACMLLFWGVTHRMSQQCEPSMPVWASAVPGTEKSVLITDGDSALTLHEKHLSVVSNRLVNSGNDGKKEVAIRLPQQHDFIKLVVPAGGEHRLTLEEGTSVQVNAATELLFPAHFTAHIRQMKMCGEAYFDVTGNKERPFVILLNGDLTIEVTGTEFNVKDYPEDDETTIALVKGCLTVYKEKQPLATLSAGQLLTYSKGSQTFAVTDVDFSGITDWTNGEFVFNNETIEEIMRKISRWYNVDIAVSDDIKHIRYTGILSRKQPLAEILEALRMTNELDFHLSQEKKMDVRAKENQH